MQGCNLLYAPPIGHSWYLMRKGKGFWFSFYNFVYLVYK